VGSPWAIPQPVNVSKTGRHLTQDKRGYQEINRRQIAQRGDCGYCLIVRTATQWRAVMGDTAQSQPLAAVTHVATGLSAPIHAADDVVAAESPAMPAADRVAGHANDATPATAALRPTAPPQPGLRTWPT
jgi:hypothetical protein